jgi:hypothetical protein
MERYHKRRWYMPMNFGSAAQMADGHRSVKSIQGNTEGSNPSTLTKPVSGTDCFFIYLP